MQIRSETHTRIAVIGMACHYPGASDVLNFWENILARRKQFRKMPAQRMRMDDYHSPDKTAMDKTYATRAAVIDGYRFDWASRSIPRQVFESTDISHWLALDIALAALADSGYTKASLPKTSTGVVVGNTLTGEVTRSNILRLRWPYVLKSMTAAGKQLGLPDSELARLAQVVEYYFKSCFPEINEDSLAGGLSNTIAGRICNFLDLNGGGYTVDGACASSLLAIATTASRLVNFEIDLGIAGGVDISLDPFELIGFAKAQALSSNGMYVYDQSAQGFIPGEGAGFVILKRYEDALKDKDYIYAVINGWGVSSDGKGGMMAPSAKGQSLAIQRAYRTGFYGIDEIDFIEGHGTGTRVGDATEIKGISLTLNGLNGQAVRPLGVTSVKSIVGHTKAASGAAGFIKAVIAVNQRVIPPTAGCEEPNRVFHDEANAIYPVLRGQIKNENDVLKAGVTGAGFGGINCHVAIESGQRPSDKLKTTLPTEALLASHQASELFVFDAFSKKDLLQSLSEFNRRVQGISDSEMVDLAFEQSVSIADRPYRAALIATSSEELAACVENLMETIALNPMEAGDFFKGTGANGLAGQCAGRQRIGFLYPGQGSQLINSARFVLERYENIRHLFNDALTAIEPEKRSRLEICYFRPTDRALNKEQTDRWQKELSQTDIAQPAICLSSMVWTNYLKRIGIVPHAAGGHSLGELSAFYAAGLFDEKQLVQLSRFRGECMTDNPEGVQGAMLGIGCPVDETDRLLKHSGVQHVVVANINTPSQTVVSGPKKDVIRFEAFIQSKRIVSKMLPVTNAFHSPLMVDAAYRLNRFISDHAWEGRPRIPIFSSMDGKALDGPIDIKSYLSDQVLAQVDFVSMVGAMRDSCDYFIEVGPNDVLTRFVNTILNETDNGIKGRKSCFPVESIRESDSFMSLNTLVGACFVRGETIKWDEFYHNRLIRPFVETAKKHFIVNPCEKEFPKASEGSERINSAKTTAWSKAQTPDPADLEAYFERRKHFILDVIKADFKSMIYGHDAIAGTQSHWQGPTRRFAEMQPAASRKSADDSGKDAVLDIIADFTGFEKEHLAMEHKLLDDLNLDSIKSATLVGKMAQLLKSGESIDPVKLANAAIGDLVSLFYGNSAGKGSATSRKMESKPDLWVRNFTETVVESALSLEKSAADQAPFAIIYNRSNRSLSVQIVEYLSQQGYRTALIDANASSTHPFPGLRYNLIVPVTEQQDSDNPLLGFLENLLSVSKHVGRAEAITYVQIKPGDFSCRSFARTLHLENPELKVRVIEFHTEPEPSDICTKIIAEHSAPERIIIAAYDQANRRTEQFMTASAGCDYVPRDIRWSKNDIVLVTGGAKGITQACASAFAARTGVKLAILGRSAKDDCDVAKTLAENAQMGIQCHYHTCDITDPDALRECVQRITSTHGPVAGIIHGAGLNRPNVVTMLSAQDAYSEISPKLLGAKHLAAIFDGQPLKIFTAFSSVIGITGMPGNAAYAFSNESLTRLLRRFKERNPDTHILSLAYSVWGETGMGVHMGSADFLMTKGIQAIPTREGVDRFLALMEKQAQNDEVVITANLGNYLDTWRMQTPDVPATYRFIDDIQTNLPGVEIRSRVTLNFRDDAYLYDHQWRGSYLFPTVFGLEAMAQAVSCVTGYAPLKEIQITDIVLERPIVVEGQGEKGIEISALVRERKKPEDPLIVDAAITTEDTGYTVKHFSATFILFQAQSDDRSLFINPNAPAIPVDPAKDLYGWLLFQGEKFQRIKSLHKLTDRECIFKTLCDSRDYALGDPYCRDSLLHAVQIPIPMDICLPVRIDNITIVDKDRKETLIGQAVINHKSEDHYLADVFLYDSNGRVVEKISGYQLKILEHHEDHPTAAALLDPDEYNNAILRAVIAGITQTHECRCPYLAIKRVPDVDRLSERQRHETERIHIQKNMQDYFTAYPDIDPQSLDIVRGDTGKPFIRGADGHHISVSHDNGHLLCTLGQDAVACDLQTIVHKSRSQWQQILTPERMPLVEELRDVDPDLSVAATRLWTVLEVMQKSADNHSATHIKIVGNDARVVLFSIETAGDPLHVVTAPVKFALGSTRIVAFCVRVEGKKTTKEPMPHNYFRSDQTLNGPQKQAVFSMRQPLSFKDTGSLGKGVYFSNYFMWMGKVRELPLKPIYSKLIPQFTSGRWGLVTNNSKVVYFDEATSKDIMETKTWIAPNTFNNDASFPLCYEWYKITPQGDKRLVAIGEQSTSWVEIVGHGLVTLRPTPDYIDTFFSQTKMLPQNDATYRPAAGNSPLRDMQWGEELYAAADGPTIVPKLDEITFLTTLEDSNLVGNIYFANYPIWQGRVRDHFFFGLAPYFYNGGRSHGELFCVESRVDHLREAMPFDQIVVRMSLKRLYTHKIVLHFDYYRKDNQEGLVKLATGLNSSIWVKHDQMQNIVPAQLPSDIIDALCCCIDPVAAKN